MASKQIRIEIDNGTDYEGTPFFEVKVERWHGRDMTRRTITAASVAEVVAIAEKAYGGK